MAVGSVVHAPDHYVALCAPHDDSGGTNSRSFVGLASSSKMTVGEGVVQAPDHYVAFHAPHDDRGGESFALLMMTVRVEGTRTRQRHTRTTRDTAKT